MIEDDMTPAERAQFEADLAHDLADEAEELHGLPKTIPDLTAAIAGLAERIAYKRQALIEWLNLPPSDLSADPAQADPFSDPLPDHVGPLRREISRLEARRNDYLLQLEQRN